MKGGLIECGLGLMLLFVLALIIRGATDFVGVQWGAILAIVLLALVWGGITTIEREKQEEQQLREQQRGYFGEDL